MTLLDKKNLVIDLGFINSIASRRQLSLVVFGFAWLIVFAAYCYQGITPAFNADDIMTMQNPDDAWTTVIQGRWGFYLIFGVLLDSNYLPLLSTVLGSLMICSSSLLVANILEFELAASRFAFIVLGSVSVYYGDLFSFDATRLAFPLGNLIAVFGLYCVIRRRWVAGIVLTALAPSFYPAAFELAATVLVAFALRRTIDTTRGGPVTALPPAACLLASLVLYGLATKALYRALGLSLDPARAKLDFLAALHRFHDIAELFTVHSVPVLAPRAEWYLPTPITLSVTALGVGFLAYSMVAAYRHAGVAGVVVAAVLNVGFIMAPYLLIFVSGGSNTQFAPRSLYAFCTVHAVWGVTLLEWSASTAQRSFAARVATIVSALLLGIIAFENAIVINKKALYDYLASQSDLLATNRIITRIETLLAETPNAPTGDIPIAVIYDRPTLAGPRGNVETSRWTPWSREWIFHLVDRHFHRVGPGGYQKFRQAAQSHSEWPGKDSVFLRDGVVVVVITK